MREKEKADARLAKERERELARLEAERRKHLDRMMKEQARPVRPLPAGALRGRAGTRVARCREHLLWSAPGGGEAARGGRCPCASCRWLRELSLLASADAARSCAHARNPRVSACRRACDRVQKKEEERRLKEAERLRQLQEKEQVRAARLV